MIFLYSFTEWRYHLLKFATDCLFLIVLELSGLLSHLNVTHIDQSRFSYRIVHHSSNDLGIVRMITKFADDTKTCCGKRREQPSVVERYCWVGTMCRKMIDGEFNPVNVSWYILGQLIKDWIMHSGTSGNTEKQRNRLHIEGSLKAATQWGGNKVV